jgi:type I restriction enzyme M protein
LFINAVNEVAREQAQSFLRERHQQKILSAYESFTDDQGFAAVASRDQIADKGYSLAIPLYVANSATSAGGEILSVDEAVEAWRTSAIEADTTIESVLALSRQAVAQ